MPDGGMPASLPAPPVTTTASLYHTRDGSGGKAQGVSACVCQRSETEAHASRGRLAPLHAGYAPEGPSLRQNQEAHAQARRGETQALAHSHTSGSTGSSSSNYPAHQTPPTTGALALATVPAGRSKRRHLARKRLFRSQPASVLLLLLARLVLQRLACHVAAPTHGMEEAAEAAAVGSRVSGRRSLTVHTRRRGHSTGLGRGWEEGQQARAWRGHGEGRTYQCRRRYGRRGARP